MKPIYESCPKCGNSENNELKFHGEDALITAYADWPYQNLEEFVDNYIKTASSFYTNRECIGHRCSACGYAWLSECADNTSDGDSPTEACEENTSSDDIIPYPEIPDGYKWVAYIKSICTGRD